jgi:hypothetical protein
MTYRYLTSQRRGAVEHLTLNRPDVRNAFNEEVIAELSAWAADVRTAAEHHDVRVAVLGGAGKTFSAGADIAWMSKTIAYTESENVRDATVMSRMFTALDELPVPLVGRRSSRRSRSRRWGVPPHVSSSSPARGSRRPGPKRSASCMPSSRPSSSTLRYRDTLKSSCPPDRKRSQRRRL